MKQPLFSWGQWVRNSSSSSTPVISTGAHLWKCNRLVLFFGSGWRCGAVAIPTSLAIPSWPLLLPGHSWAWPAGDWKSGLGRGTALDWCWGPLCADLSAILMAVFNTDVTLWFTLTESPIHLLSQHGVVHVSQATEELLYWHYYLSVPTWESLQWEPTLGARYLPLLC